MELFDQSLFFSKLEEAARAELEETALLCTQATATLPLLNMRAEAMYNHVMLGMMKSSGLADIKSLLFGLMAVHQAIGFEAGRNYGELMALGKMSGWAAEREPDAQR
jgi:hypothetical protein